METNQSHTTLLPAQLLPLPWTGTLSRLHLAVAAASAIVLSGNAQADVRQERLDSSVASPGFRFEHIAPPAVNDAAAKASLQIVAGRADPNGATISALTDGRVPTDEDQPGSNFFFAPGSDGGRILIDLGRPVSIERINSYSWHPAERGPQVYSLFGALTNVPITTPPGKEGTSFEGWERIARVDTRPSQGDLGGQYGVTISNLSGVIGPFRYLLLDVAPTTKRSSFGQTFFSEIDVIEAGTSATLQSLSREPKVLTVHPGNGAYEATIDLTEMPELTEWAEQRLVPMIDTWYPRILEMLPSDGFQAPRRFSITFSRNMQGVAATSGGRIRCAGRWFSANLEGEAVGAVFHEMVHLVQHYGRVRRSTGAESPGWLVEGIADYLRFYQFEPETHGADIPPSRADRANYTRSYRVTANFLNWVTTHRNKDIVRKLNEALRNGKYRSSLWESLTGSSLEELNKQWKESLSAGAPEHP